MTDPVLRNAQSVSHVAAVATAAPPPKPLMFVSESSGSHGDGTYSYIFESATEHLRFEIGRDGAPRITFYNYASQTWSEPRPLLEDERDTIQLGVLRTLMARASDDGAGDAHALDAPRHLLQWIDTPGFWEGTIPFDALPVDVAWAKTRVLSAEKNGDTTFIRGETARGVFEMTAAPPPPNSRTLATLRYRSALRAEAVGLASKEWSGTDNYVGFTVMRALQQFKKRPPT